MEEARKRGKETGSKEEERREEYMKGRKEERRRGKKLTRQGGKEVESMGGREWSARKQERPRQQGGAGEGQRRDMV